MTNYPIQQYTNPTRAVGPHLIGGAQMTLPTHRCACCGALVVHDPRAQRQQRKAYTSPGVMTWIILAFIGPLPAWLVHRLTRQHADVDYTLCSACTARFDKRRSIYWLNWFLASAVLFPAFVFGSSGMVAAFLMLLFMLPVTSLWSRFRLKLRPTNAPGQFMLSGVHEATMHELSHGHHEVSTHQPMLPPTPRSQPVVHPSTAPTRPSGPAGSDGWV